MIGPVLVTVSWLLQSEATLSAMAVGCWLLGLPCLSTDVEQRKLNSDELNSVVIAAVVTAV